MNHQPVSSDEVAPPPRRRAFLVLSGGQDSATCGLIAQREADLVGAVHFEYGQRHAVEIDCAMDVALYLGLPLFFVPINTFSVLGDSALLRPLPSAPLRPRDVSTDHEDAERATAAINRPHPRLQHLPATFVPGRNLAMLTFAAALAQKQGADVLYTGVCQTDYSGYPDCRSETIAALQVALRLGMDFPELEIRTPLMYLDKAQTFQVADQLGALDLILKHTHTCYNGDRTELHAWGYGCGACPACQLRRRGWEQFSQARTL